MVLVELFINVLYYRDLDHSITFKGVEINADPTNIRNGITRPLKFVILGQAGVGKSDKSYLFKNYLLIYIYLS
jgi:hypothetical protein